MSHRKWNLLPPIPDRCFTDSSGLSPLIIQLLYNRGLTEPEQFRPFLTAGRELADNPFQLPDMDKAVKTVYQSLLSGDNITVYGDFDADGITATALLAQGLSSLGGKITPYIPHRQTEGHGLSVSALKNLKQQGTKLVISVDCGITDVLPVKKARQMGLDVVITDHHTPLEEIPQANAVVNPKLANSNYPFIHFAGVGVAFKLLEALLKSLGKEEQLSRVIDLVTIGTITDMSPLVGENRYLVKEGLKEINASPRLGLKEMINQAKIEPGTIDAERIGWTIGPCLNAAGRLADGLTGYNLLMTQSPEEARELALWLARKNEERQRLTASTLAKARQQVLDEGLPQILVTGDHEYPIGIAGLVAGRLVEEFYRPAIVMHTSDKITHGSCRSIPEFNIVDALNQHHQLLSQYGGHSQAAGFTMPTKNLPALKQELSQLATEHLAGIELRPHTDIDAEVKLSELAGDTYQTIQMLAPFGVGNPMPTFLSKGVELTESRTMGSNGDHLRLKLRQNGSIWDAVGFRLGNHQAELASMIDVVYNLEIDRWNGNEKLRLNIIDLAKTT